MVELIEKFFQLAEAMMDTESIQQKLRETGIRLTAPRRAVVSALAAAERALTLQEILDKARYYHPSLSLATLYRVIELLQRLEFVRRVHFDHQGCQRYFLTPPGHWHQLVCLECGRVVRFPGGEDLQGLQRELEATTGFQVEDHLLQFYGRCPEHRKDEDN
jgi:Fur family ferric uptake transcriptional regulator